MISWIDQVRDLPVVDIGQRLGLEIRSGPSLAPCPSCGAPRRSMSNPAEHRGPVGVTTNGLGWRCHRCAAGGDAIDLVRHVQGDDGVRAWFVQQGLITATAARGGYVCKPTPPEPRRAPQTAQPMLRPPADEIAALWASAHAVVDDPGVCAWLLAPRADGGRGWPRDMPARVADRDLARVLLPSHQLPPWACYGSRPWTATGHRLLVPLWGPGGDLVSLRARYCRQDPIPTPKSLTPYRRRPIGQPPYATRGLVMADLGGLGLLRRAAVPWLPSLWVCEGEIDYLRLATWWGDAADDAPAVWGITAGSLSSDLAACVPAGLRVIAATDPDTTGDKYAAQLCDALAGRCVVERHKQGGDDGQRP